jgi:tRNA A58 N-methylase Trm61
MLNNPLRRSVANPAHKVEALGLTGSEHVLEVGPGPGFYSVEIARRLAYGRLDLFDIQPEMLDKARRQLERAGFRDVGYTTGHLRVRRSDRKPMARRGSFPPGSIPPEKRGH